MTSRILLICAAILVSTSCAANQPPPSMNPARIITDPDLPKPVEEEALPATPQQRTYLYKGEPAQAALTFWKTEAGSDVFLDGKLVPVDREGHFAIGFGRDHEGDAELRIIYPDGTSLVETIAVADREFPISRIDGLPPSKVNTFTDEQLAKIGEDRELKNAARADRTATSYWRAGFDWPVKGRISTRMGAQRILNGNPARPHSGTDVAAPPGTTPMEFQGTDIRAPSTGRVTLAHDDMYFEGGLVFIDHGQEIESVLMHMSRVDVKPGQIVTKGEVIGAVGMTGRATGPHLHWTLNWRGTPMDPQLLVPPME